MGRSTRLLHVPGHQVVPCLAADDQPGIAVVDEDDGDPAVAVVVVGHRVAVGAGRGNGEQVAHPRGGQWDAVDQHVAAFAVPADDRHRLRIGPGEPADDTGLEPLVRPDVPALRRSRLSWARQNYLRAETLTQANARLVAAQNGIDLARRWGGGDVASADGLRFVVPVRTIHAGPNPKHFGADRGVTYYNLVSGR